MISIFIFKKYKHKIISVISQERNNIQDVLKLNKTNLCSIALTACANCSTWPQTINVKSPPHDQAYY